MPTITSSGVVSGLNVASMVSQLVAAERAPYDARYTRIDVKLTTEMSALSQLKGAASAFQSALANLKEAAAFNQRKVTVADDASFAATATASAAAGSYDVEVVQLAKAAQLGTPAFVGGPDTVVGAGTLSIAMGASSFNVTLPGADATLANLRDAINSAPGNPGVRATLIRDVDGAHLVLTGSATGAANALRVTANGGLTQFTHDPPTTTTNYTVLSAAQDAIVEVSGYEIRDSDNSVGDAIDGVTLTLKKAEPGTLVRLSVDTDSSAIRERVNGFVTSYNTLASQIAKQRAYDPATRAAGPLLGDVTLRNLETQLRRLVSEPVAGVTGSYSTLASLGITSSASGTLSVNQARLDAALAAEPAAVSQVFASSQGIAVQLDTFLKGKLATDGEFAARDAGNTARRKDLTRQREALEARMVVIEARYSRQFNALDSMLTKMQSTSSYLAQQLAASSGQG